MSLEKKVMEGEKSLLRRFLNRAKSTLTNVALGASLAAALASCDGRKRRPAPAPANNAPVITTTAPTSGMEGSLYNYDVDATDADGDPLSYSLVTAPAWASINSTTGLISGTPTDSGANRTDNFTVRVSDSKANTDQSFGVGVTNLGTVSGTGQIKDIDGNGLASKTVHLWNSTYPRGRFTGLTNGSGDFTIVDTNIPALGGIPNGSYNLEAEDNFTGMFKFLQPNYTTNNNSHSVTGIPPMILMHAIASTNTAYQDSLGNASFLALFKYETGKSLSSFPTGGPHPTVTWPTSSVPIPVYLNTLSAPAGDVEDAAGNPGANSVPDYIDRARRALAEWNTQAGMTLFTETGSTPSQGIRFLWPSTVTGGGNGFTNVDWTNADGTYGRISIQVANFLSLNPAFITMKHELGHALYNINHSADNLYIMYPSGSLSGNVHTDEGRVAKYNTKLPHNTNMDLYVDQ